MKYLTTQTHAQTEKEVAPAKENNLFLNTLNRNHYLANQVFDSLNYANKPAEKQKICMCGDIIPRDWTIFNNSARCRSCEAEKFNQPKIEPAQKFCGKQIKLMPCHGCAGAFGPAKMRDDQRCLNCIGNYEATPKIARVLNNFLHSRIQSGGLYVS